MLNPRRKGKGYEYHIRDLINHKFKCPENKCRTLVKRTPMSGAIDGWKADMTFLCRHTIWNGFTVECKKVEKINIWDCLKQAIRQASKTPLLIFSRNQDIDYVAMRLEDFVYILQELEEFRNDKHEDMLPVR